MHTQLSQSGSAAGFAANHHLSGEYHYPFKTTLYYPFETRHVRALRVILFAITPSKLRYCVLLPLRN